MTHCKMSHKTWMKEESFRAGRPSAQKRKAVELETPEVQPDDEAPETQRHHKQVLLMFVQCFQLDMLSLSWSASLCTPCVLV